MSLPQVTLLNSSDQVYVKIAIGHALIGVYNFWLWDATGKIPELISSSPASANNGLIEIPHPAADLDQRILHWKINIASPQAGSGRSRYSAYIKISQNEKLLKGGEFEWDDQYTGPLVIDGGARLNTPRPRPLAKAGI